MIVAIFFSLPIYFNYILIKSSVNESFFTQIFFTFFLLGAFYSFFTLKHSYFQTGFFIGLFWFWWVGLSFRYYGFWYLIPLVSVFIALFYGTVFWILAKVSFLLNREWLIKLFWVLIFTYGFDYLSPFTFDWLKPEVLFVNSFFNVDKLSLLAVILALAFFEKKYPILLLVFALVLKPGVQKLPPLDIYLASTDIPQNKKWDKNYIPYEIKNDFSIINKAIKLKKDVVVLPESAFPLFLNMYPSLVSSLKKLSYSIVIITGALHYKNGKYYNAAYIFEKGKVTIVDKHVLVPFGEYIPLPFFQKEINRFFFGGASDYVTAKNFGEFNIKGYRFISAICYEASVESLYKLKPKYVMALSNVAWFTPSVMPSLQEMLIKVYARKYKKVVFHSINGFKSYVIR